MRAGARSGVPLSGLSYRTVAAEELPACAGIWRTSINDYIVPMGQPEIAPEFIPLLRLYAHLQATDPERFVVATVPDDGRERVVAFASAVVRERFWYLSMLFVLPEFQGAGLGRALLRQVLPHGDTSARATATDSAQPISNALYASYGTGAAHAVPEPDRAAGTTRGVRAAAVRRGADPVRRARDGSQR